MNIHSHCVRQPKTKQNYMVLLLALLMALTAIAVPTQAESQKTIGTGSMTPDQHVQLQLAIANFRSLPHPADTEVVANKATPTDWPRLFGASANYFVQWDVSSSSGGISNSEHYQVVATIGQSIDGNGLDSTTYAIESGFLAPPDTDKDALRDFLDNCLVASNTDQNDADGDGFGNACDADFNNDCVVNFLDLALFSDNFLTSEFLYDLDGGGSVNFLDLTIMRTLFFLPPGPSQLPNSC